MECEGLVGEARSLAHRAVTEGVNLKYVDRMRRALYELADGYELLRETLRLREESQIPMVPTGAQARLEQAERERDSLRLKVEAGLHNHAADNKDLIAQREHYRGALVQIAGMPTTERNPDGDEQAAHSMQLVAQDALVTGNTQDSADAMARLLLPELAQQLEQAEQRRPDPWPIIDWLRENMPRALELCPYKVHEGAEAE